MRVLIVEDNIALASLVVKGLDQSCIDADRAGSVDSARHAITTVEYAAIILDLGLPDGDGLELLRELRARGYPAPILIISARHGLEDRLRGLREGADDYLAKPFSVHELVARLHAVMRRPGRIFAGPTLYAGNVSLDVKNRQVNIGDHAHVVRLSEIRILELLMRHLGNVVSRKHFEDHLFGLDAEQESNTIDVYVHRLRQQLADGGATVSIHTIRGVGYMMTDDKQTRVDL